jgi:hypothetical protein
MEEGRFNTPKWIGIALINFCLVALAGITLRYKINFPLPLLNQKNLLHGHSHFAFTGWVTLALMALMVNYLLKQQLLTNYKKYYWILLANCITAYGMLISFIIQGYAAFSITFSTLSIFVSYFFIFHFWRDLDKVRDESYAVTWFKASLVILGISSLGAFSLAFLMARHIMVQDFYFGAIYFFLHFQYNGWFLFACFGLLFSYLHSNAILTSQTINKKLFLMMVITVGPSYFLSILWLKLPKILHLIADVSGVLQVLILIYFISLLTLVKEKKPTRISATTRYLWILAAVAFILKIILQMLSIIPFLTSYAFGFRPIVIGYLHLSFLGIISFFILGYINQVISKKERGISTGGVILFIAGVLAQEIVLMVQGLEALEFEPFRYASIILFFTAIMIGGGLSWITWSYHKNNADKVLNPAGVKLEV